MSRTWIKLRYPSLTLKLHIREERKKNNSCLVLTSTMDTKHAMLVEQ